MAQASTERQPEPGAVYWRLVEPIWKAISIYDGPEVFLAQFDAAPVVAHNLLAAHWCESEVCNGGFIQLFENSTGVLAPEARTAFAAIGMPRTAEVVQEAVAAFGDTYPRGRAARNRQLKKIDPDMLDALDDKFYEFLESESGGWDAAADRYALESNPQVQP